MNHMKSANEVERSKRDKNEKFSLERRKHGSTEETIHSNIIT